MTDAVAAVVADTAAAAVLPGATALPADPTTKAAEPAVVAAVTPPTEVADKPLDEAVWGSTGDSVGDSTLALLQNAGMTPADAKAILYDALAAGDMAKVDKAALVAKVGKDRAALILAGAENFLTRSTAKATGILTDVHTTVGGKENWTAITAWVKAGVPEAEIAEYRSMIDAGGARARFAAAELASRYNADTKNTTLSAKEAEIIPSSKAGAAVRETSRAEYVAELSRAHRNKAGADVINEITAARHAGRAKGK